MSLNSLMHHSLHTSFRKIYFIYKNVYTYSMDDALARVNDIICVIVVYKEKFSVSRVKTTAICKYKVTKLQWRTASVIYSQCKDVRCCSQAQCFALWKYLPILVFLILHRFQLFQWSLLWIYCAFECDVLIMSWKKNSHWITICVCVVKWINPWTYVHYSISAYGTVCLWRKSDWTLGKDANSVPWRDIFLQY